MRRRKRQRAASQVRLRARQADWSFARPAVVWDRAQALMLSRRLRVYSNDWVRGWTGGFAVRVLFRQVAGVTVWSRRKCLMK